MAKPKDTPARIYGMKCMARLHQTMLPLLMANGVRRVESGIGRPYRFFQRARQRDAMRVSDFFAACAQIAQDPVDLVAKAMTEEVDSEIRPPRIVLAARKRLDAPGEGLGAQRLEELEAAKHSDRRNLRQLLRQELTQAARDELPLVLGLYASVLRFEGDLCHAALVFREAIEMAQELDALSAEAHLLIRMAYLTLEWQSPSAALQHAQEGTLAYACLGEVEGQARGFLAMGIFHYYVHNFRRSLRFLSAATDRARTPMLLCSAYHNSASCYLRLDQRDLALQYAEMAQQLAGQVDGTMRAKISWFQARLAEGLDRFELFKAAQEDLADARPADCILVTLDLIEDLVAYGYLEEAAGEIPRLCTLVERAAECRQVQQAVSRLISHHSHLTPDLTQSVRQALDRARDRRLSNLTSDEL